MGGGWGQCAVLTTHVDVVFTSLDSLSFRSPGGNKSQY